MMRRARDLFRQPIVAAAAVALIIVVPLLAQGEISDNEARARARTEMFEKGAGVAEQAIRQLEVYFLKAGSELKQIASGGDLRQAIKGRDTEVMYRALAQAAPHAGQGKHGLPRVTRVALTDERGNVLIEVGTDDVASCFIDQVNSAFAARHCDAATFGAASRGKNDPVAAALLTPNTTQLFRLSEPFVNEVDGRRTAVVAMGALITAKDESISPIGMLLMEADLGAAQDSPIRPFADRTEDLYVIDRAGRYVTGSREGGAEPLMDLTGSALFAKAVRTQPILPTSPRVTLREEGVDPFTGTSRPFATAVMTNLARGFTNTLIGQDQYGWQVIVVPDQTSLQSVDATLTQLRLARVALSLVLVLSAFLLVAALRATSRQRTALAASNAALQRATIDIEAASRHKSEFLANMSHELRTPLNAVIGFSDVLEQRMVGDLNDKQAEYVRDISTSGKHLLDLVNEILDLSKVEAGRMDLEPSEFALSDSIESAVAFIRERAARHRIEIASDIAPDVRTIKADERKLRQVLLNLLSNAVKFTPDGGWVGVSARREDGEIRVSVRDTGIGIAPEDQPKVFEEFQQVGRPSDRSREGTGLGLTLAKRFIELHGGRIWLESEVGKGTTFTFALPVVAREEVAL